MKHKPWYVLAGLTVLFASCVGAKAEIALRADGSGTIKLEYRISQKAESLGKLDGNEGWPIVPLGKADFERTVQRIEGLRLRSFSTRTEGKDLVNRVRLDFSSPAALAAFLDPSGGAVFATEGGKRRLSLNLGAGTEGTDPRLLTLFQSLSEGYFVELAFSLPNAGELALYDKPGKPRPSPDYLETQVRGTKASVKAPIGSLVADPQGLRVELRW